MEEESETGIPDFAYLFNQLTSQSLEPVMRVAENPKFSQILCVVEPVNSAAVVAGLMLEPEMQSNAYRLEAISHLILGGATGDAKPSREQINDLFTGLEGTIYQYNEDLAEDVLVTLVNTHSGSFRILEGLWESSSSKLQRFIQILETMPDSGRFLAMKTKIENLLKISEAVIERANLHRYTLGNSIPHTKIDKKILLSVDETISKVRFDQQDLDELEIDRSCLTEFVFDANERSTLLENSFGSSLLERRPIFDHEGSLYVMLPTAISVAIRRLIIETCQNMGLLEILERSFQEETCLLLEKTSVLGKIQGIKFSPIQTNSDDVIGGSVVVEIDTGRFIHFVLLFDDFKDCEIDSFNGVSPNAEVAGDVIYKTIQSAASYVVEQQGYRSGTSLIVVAGWGRPVAVSIPKITNDSWSLESISVEDLIIFSQIPDITPLTYLRLLEAKKKIESTGLKLQNVNGILNLYGWAKSQNFHLVPHEQLPQDLALDPLGSFVLSINQNSLLDVRAAVQQGLDIHSIQSPTGDQIVVQRISPESFFKEDKDQPIYGSIEDALNGTLRSVVYSKCRAWWSIPEFSEGAPFDLTFKIWESLNIWINKATKILDAQLNPQFDGDVIWQWKISDDKLPESPSFQIPTYEDLIGLTETIFSVDSQYLTVTSIFSKGFILGFHQEKNLAEKALIRSLVEGIYEYCSEHPTIEEVESATSVIVDNPDARHVHFFTTHSFMDYVRNSLPNSIGVNELDDATSRIGLGWKSTSNPNNSIITGKSNCTSYLNDIVSGTIEEMKELMYQLDRRTTITRLLRNHEAFEAEMQRWKFSFRAILALREHKSEITRTVARELSRINSGTIGSRIAIEIGLCTCSEDGGYKPGTLDLSKLVTFGASIFHLGNWSDIIHYGGATPELHISPLGNILFDQSFTDEVVDPYGNEIQFRMLASDAKKYSDKFSLSTAPQTKANDLEGEFLDAWYMEYGFTLDEGISIIESLESEGITRGSAVYELPSGELLSVANRICSNSEAVVNFVSVFSLSERSAWEDIPGGFSVEDIMPWRFRRRLSCVSRPLITSHGSVIIAPGLVRKGLSYLLDQTYNASMDDSLFNSKSMRQWIGRKRNHSGHEFNRQVAEKFHAIGWQAEHDVQITRILNSKLDKDYGDVDVLAWNSDSSTVYVIECKSLEFAKTPSEIARQTFEFRGVVKANGKADRLRKHLDRIALLSESWPSVERYVGLTGGASLKPALCFSQPVPLSYIESKKLSKVDLFTIEDISDGFNLGP